MVQGALKSTKSALAGGDRSNGAGKKAALGPKKGQRVIKAKKKELRRSEVLTKVGLTFFLFYLWVGVFTCGGGVQRARGVKKRPLERKRRWQMRKNFPKKYDMMTHLHMHGFPSCLLE